MKAHAAAIVAALKAGFPVATVYDTNVPDEPTFPYLLFEAPAFADAKDTFAATLADVDDDFAVTVVGKGIEQVRDLLDDLRGCLDESHPTVAGFSARCDFLSARPVQVDRDMTIPGAGHPVFAVEQYRYRATPA